MRHNKFILLLDSYDETKQLLNFVRPILLNFGNKKTDKIIITCRSDYLTGMSNSQIIDLFSSKTADSKESVQQLWISPLEITKQFLELYFKHYFEPSLTVLSHDSNIEMLNKKIKLSATDQITIYNNPDVSKVKCQSHSIYDYIQTIYAVPNLIDLLKTPMLLTMITNILPKIQSFESNLINRSLIFDLHIQKQQKREFATLSKVRIELINKELTNLNTPFREASFKEVYNFIGCNLAAIMFENDKNYIELRNDSPVPFLENILKLQCSENFNLELGSTLLRGLPLTIIQNQENKLIQIHFNHDNLRDFYLVNQIIKEIENLENFQESSLLQMRLQTKNLDFIQIFTDKLSSQPTLSNSLLQIIYQSKYSHSFDNEIQNKLQIAASNAITILNGARFSFSGLDFSNIQIPNANLTNAIMHQTILKGANLDGANLRNVNMQEADISNANLNNIQFGELPVLEGHDSAIISVAYNQRGFLILSASCDKTVRIWDALKFKCIQILEGHKNMVLKVIFSIDDSLIASGDNGGQIIIWRNQEMINEQQIQNINYKMHITLEGDNQTPIISLIFTKDKSQLISQTSKQITIWEQFSIIPNQQQIQNKIIETEKEFQTMALSKGEQFLAIGEDIGFISLGKLQIYNNIQYLLNNFVEPESIKHSHSLMLNTDSSSANQSYSIQFIKDDKQIICSCGRHLNIINIINNNQFELIFQYKTTYNYWILQISLNKYEDMIATCAFGQSTIKLFKLEQNKIEEIQSLVGHHSEINSIQFMMKNNQNINNEERLVSGSHDDTIRQWIISAEQLQLQVKQSNFHYQQIIQGISTSFDKKFIITVDNFHVKVWNAHTLSIHSEIHSYFSKCASMNQQNDLIIVGESEGNVKVIDIKQHTSPSLMTTLKICKSQIKLIELTLDSSKMVSCTDESIIIYNRIENSILHHLEGAHENAKINCIKLNKSGNQLLSGGNDALVRIWDVNTGKQLDCLYKWPMSSFECVEWSHKILIINLNEEQSQYVASGDKQYKSIIIWKLANYLNQYTKTIKYQYFKELICIDSVLSVQFSQNDCRLLSGDKSQTITIWEILSGIALRKIVNGGEICICINNDERVIGINKYDKDIRQFYRNQNNNEYLLQKRIANNDQKINLQNLKNAEKASFFSKESLKKGELSSTNAQNKLFITQKLKS